MVQTCRIVTLCFATAQAPVPATITMRDDDDDSNREIVAVSVFSSAREDIGKRVSTRLVCHSKCCQEKSVYE